jgi:hypothetical protein
MVAPALRRVGTEGERMMVATRPTPERFADAGWDDIRPLFDDLAARPLDATIADAWLAEWSAREG